MASRWIWRRVVAHAEQAGGLYLFSTSDPGRSRLRLVAAAVSCVAIPIVATVGRLDRDTTGLLLMTDDGKLLHKIVSPRSKLPKIYEATLARDLRGDEVKMFASGKMMLESEREPLAPAKLEVARTETGETHADRRSLSSSAPDVRGRRQSCREAAPKPRRWPRTGRSCPKADGARSTLPIANGCSRCRADRGIASGSVSSVGAVRFLVDSCPILQGWLARSRTATLNYV